MQTACFGFFYTSTVHAHSHTNHTQSVISWKQWCADCRPSAHYFPDYQSWGLHFQFMLMLWLWPLHIIKNIPASNLYESYIDVVRCILIIITIITQ